MCPTPCILCLHRYLVRHSPSGLGFLSLLISSQNPASGPEELLLTEVLLYVRPVLNTYILHHLLSMRPYDVGLIKDESLPKVRAGQWRSKPRISGIIPEFTDVELESREATVPCSSSPRCLTQSLTCFHVSYGLPWISTNILQLHLPFSLGNTTHSFSNCQLSAICMLPFLLRPYSGALCTLSYVIHTAVLVVFHVRDEETEIQRNELIYLKSSSNSLSPEFNPGLPDFKFYS